MEQPPDDVEIEPDEHTDAFTVSFTSYATLRDNDALLSTHSVVCVCHMLKIADRLSHNSQCPTNTDFCCQVSKMFTPSSDDSDIENV